MRRIGKVGLSPAKMQIVTTRVRDLISAKAHNSKLVEDLEGCRRSLDQDLFLREIATFPRGKADF